MVDRSDIKPHTSPPSVLAVDPDADNAFRAETAKRRGDVPNLVSQSMDRLNRPLTASDGSPLPSPMQQITQAHGVMMEAGATSYSLAHLVGLSTVETSGRAQAFNTRSGADGPFQITDRSFFYDLKKYGTQIMPHLNPEAVNTIKQAMENITFVPAQPAKNGKPAQKEEFSYNQTAVEWMARYRNNPYLQSLLTAAHVNAHKGAAGKPENAWGVNVLGADGAVHVLNNLPLDPNKPITTDAAHTRIDQVVSASTLKDNEIPPGTSVEAVRERFFGYYGDVVHEVSWQHAAAARAEAATLPVSADRPGWVGEAASASPFLMPHAPIVRSPATGAGQLKQEVINRDKLDKPHPAKETSPAASARPHAAHEKLSLR